MRSVFEYSVQRTESSHGYEKEKYVDGQIEKVNTSCSALGNLDLYMGQSFTL